MTTTSFEFDLPKHRSSHIKVIGVGGGGSNAVNHMFQQGIEGVDFVVCNTDAQALNNSPVPNRIQLGQATTEGLGAGANPEVGEQAALESIDEIRNLLDVNTKMVFITAGMGGGTGTGAAPIIAGVAKELGILTIGIVTAPFSFEGKMRLEQAEAGIEKLQKNVDSLIVINNDKLRELYGNLGYKASFAKADEVLTTGAKGIAEVISKHYATNIDLRDARTVLADSGTAIMGTGIASGDNKASDAITAALDSPLLNNNHISGAKNVLLLIVSGENEITMDEIALINEFIQKEAGNSANIIMGVGEDSELGENISVTVVATGFPLEEQVFTGKEEEKIYHRLEEEQAITKTLSPETPFPVHVNKMPEDLAEAPLQEVIESEEKEVRYYLELPEETPQKPIETPTEPEITLETREFPLESGLSFDKKSNDDTNVPQTTMFTLDDDDDLEEVEQEIIFETMTEEHVAEQVQVQPKVEMKMVEVEERTIEEEDPFDQPISNSLSQAIEERRARLKQFNYKFKSTLNNKTVDELEDMPAYKRQGLELSGKEEQMPSDFIITQDSNNEMKIRPNNFLHDKVD
ncbi:MAG TPA: cell division protein FtsZ [Moheibacter sp.]|nr:cell division protein FtsZ [Moheibacter sp.]